VIELKNRVGSEIEPFGIRDALVSTVSTSQAPSQVFPDESDPFRYGWRHVHVQRADGTEDIEQVPLTLEDVLHPEFGDHIVHSTAHAEDVNYLKYVFDALLAGDVHAAVLSDCGVDWNLPGVRVVSPDSAIFFSVAKRIDWSIFDVEAEQARPVLVIEVVSLSTRSNDFGKKFDYYHRAGVETYVIADVRVDDKLNRKLELIAYRHTPKSYQRIPANEDGRIWLDALGVWLGVSQNRSTGADRLACFHPTTNEEIGTYTAITQALAADIEARNRAEAQAARAQDEAAKAQDEAAKAQDEAAKAQDEAAKAQDEAAKAQDEAAKAQDEAATARAQAAQAQADATAEAQARIAAEARIRELEAMLKRSAPNS
jgi:colicin import membrane protein